MLGVEVSLFVWEQEFPAEGMDWCLNTGKCTALLISPLLTLLISPSSPVAIVVNFRSVCCQGFGYVWVRVSASFHGQRCLGGNGREFRLYAFVDRVLFLFPLES